MEFFFRAVQRLPRGRLASTLPAPELQVVLRRSLCCHGEDGVDGDGTAERLVEAFDGCVVDSAPTTGGDPLRGTRGACPHAGGAQAVAGETRPAGPLELARSRRAPRAGGPWAAGAGPARAPGGAGRAGAGRPSRQRAGGALAAGGSRTRQPLPRPRGRRLGAGRAAACGRRAAGCLWCLGARRALRAGPAPGGAGRTRSRHWGKSRGAPHAGRGSRPLLS